MRGIDVEITTTTKNKTNWDQQLGVGREISGFHFSRKIADKRKEAFYSELHVMISTGIDLRSALEIVATGQGKQFNATVTSVHDQVVKGMSFSEALKFVGEFSAYEFISIRIGEETGMLSTVLKQLSLHFSIKVKQRRMLVNAISYPLLVLMASIGAVIFMLQVVVPMFEDVFSRFGNDLPALTRAVIAVSDMLSSGYGYFLATGAVLFGIGYFNRGSAWYQRLVSQVVLSVPVMGNIILSNQLSRFSSAMHLLTSARHPLIDALKLLGAMITFYPIRTTLDDIADKIEKGSQLHQAMARHRVYPQKMISLIAMGEEVNNLDKIFLRISEQYSEEVQYKSAILGSVLEPVLIIFIGAMVAIILIAMYLPLFELSTNIG